MFTQMSLDWFLVTKHPTYMNLTLEFLSSFHFQPHIGLGQNRGSTIFILFGREYRFTSRELARLLAFQYDPHAYSEVPDDAHMQGRLDYFLGRIIEDFPPNPEAINTTLIHNPSIQYFQMVIA